MPSTASSSLRGLDFRLPFFLNISPSVDATISPRFCFNRAFQTGLEFRYNPSDDLKGRFYGEYTYDWKYGPPSDPVKNLFYAVWRHDQDLSGAARLKTNVQWVSDRNYFDIWGGRFDKRLRVRYMESNAVLYRQTNSFLLQAEARYFDNLDLPDNARTVQNLPILTATLFDRQVPYTPFYLSSNLTYNYFHAPLMNEAWSGSRLQWDTRLTLPISFGRYLKFDPSMTYFARGYAGDYYEHDKSVSSVNSFRADLYQINSDAFTDIDKIYEGALFGFQKIKHTIRPRVAWTYRPLRSRQTYPHFDESDRMDEVSLLTAEVRQSLVGRVSQGQYLDFASLSLSQGYDFHNTRTAEDPLGERSPLKSHWTNTQAELSIRPHSLLDLRAQAEYDPVMNRARSYSVNLGVMDHRGDTIQILHQFAEDELREDLNRQTNLNLQVKVTSAIDFFLENQYTHQFNFAYFTSLGLNYHPHLARGHAGGTERRGADERHAGPRGGDGDEQSRVLPPAPGDLHGGEDVHGPVTPGSGPAALRLRRRRAARGLGRRRRGSWGGCGVAGPGAHLLGDSEPARKAMPTIATISPTRAEPACADPLASFSP